MVFLGTPEVPFPPLPPCPSPLSSPMSLQFSQLQADCGPSGSQVRSYPAGTFASCGRTLAIKFEACVSFDGAMRYKRAGRGGVSILA